MSFVAGSTTVIFTVVDPTSMPITTLSGALAMRFSCVRRADARLD
jgi:hypothetical protein